MDSRKSFFITTVKCSNLPWPLITPNISLCREKRAISNFLRIYCYFPVIRLVNFVQVAQSAGKQIRLCCGDFLYYNKKTYVTISVCVCLYHFRLHFSFQFILWLQLPRKLRSCWHLGQKVTLRTTLSISHHLNFKCFRGAYPTIMWYVSFHSLPAL